MKKSYKLIATAVLSAMFLSSGKNTFAGNPDRAGQSGATELLINPWTRSTGGPGGVRMY